MQREYSDVLAEKNVLETSLRQYEESWKFAVQELGRVVEQRDDALKRVELCEKVEKVGSQQDVSVICAVIMSRTDHYNTCANLHTHTQTHKRTHKHALFLFFLLNVGCPVGAAVHLTECYRIVLLSCRAIACRRASRHLSTNDAI